MITIQSTPGEIAETIRKVKHLAFNLKDLTEVRIADEAAQALTTLQTLRGGCEDKHVWLKIKPHDQQGSSVQTDIKWCGKCGTVKVSTSYNAIGKYDEHLYVPDYLTEKEE